MQIANQLAIAAGVTVDNALADSQFTFLSAPSAVSVAVVQAGVAAGDIQAQFSIGSTIVSDKFFPKLKATLGINVNEDITISDAGNAGERLTLKLTNTSGLAVTVEFLVSIQPL